MSRTAFYFIGYWNQSKTQKILIPKCFRSLYSFTLQPSKTGEILPKGEYLFKVAKDTLKVYRGRDTGSAVPVVRITEKMDRNYLNSSFRSAIFRILIMNYYTSKAPNFKVDHHYLHRCMRIFRSLGYEWIPLYHNRTSRKRFYSNILNRIKSGDFNPYNEFWKKAFRNPYRKSKNGNYKKHYLTLFDLELAFDPRYDELIPASVGTLNDGLRLFESRDVGSYITVAINNTNDLSIYRKYIPKNIKFKVIPADTVFSKDRLVGYYDFPTDREEYEEMINSATVHQILRQKEDSNKLICEDYAIISVPHSNSGLNMVISFRTFPDLFLKVYERNGPYFSPLNSQIYINNYFITDDVDGFLLGGADTIGIRFRNGMLAKLSVFFITNYLKGECENYKITKEDDKYFFEKK